MSVFRYFGSRVDSCFLTVSFFLFFKKDKVYAAWVCVSLNAVLPRWSSLHFYLVAELCQVFAQSRICLHWEKNILLSKPATYCSFDELWVLCCRLEWKAVCSKRQYLSALSSCHKRQGLPWYSIPFVCQSSCKCKCWQGQVSSSPAAYLLPTWPWRIRSVLLFGVVYWQREISQPLTQVQLLLCIKKRMKEIDRLLIRTVSRWADNILGHVFPGPAACCSSQWIS